MPPDKPRGRPADRTAPHNTISDAGSGTRASLPPAAVTGTCSWCQGPLPKGRRRFCCDDHRRRGQKAERKIEDTDYASGVRRLVRAQGKRAGADLPMFVLFAGSVDYARARLQDAADQLIAQGYSYGDIGRALGITRQGARQRFGRQQAVVSETPEPGAAS